jgi:molecular chaperone DnaJ
MGEHGGPSGNLYIVLDVEPHPIFQRRNDDVLIELRINFAQAALGGEVNVPTLEGEETIAIPSGTQNDTVLRLRNKGVPHVQRNGRGDELVVVRVATPDKLSREQRELFEQLAQTLEPETVTQVGQQPERGFFETVREALGL